MLLDIGERHRSAGRAAPAVLALALIAYATGMGAVAPAAADPTEPVRPISIAVDIRPGLCPNHLRVESPLTIPIAVLGMMDFEVSNLEPASLRLSRDGVAEEIEPISWVYADVGRPVVGGLCACHNLRGDGLDDLELYFSIEDLATKLSLESHIGEVVPLTLSGKLITDEAVEGADCAVVISGPWAGEGLGDSMGDEIGVLTCAGDESAQRQFTFTYYTTVSDRVTFAIHDVKGEVVAKLADMDMAPGIYQATWDGTSRNRERVPTGTYFARVSNSWTSDTKKITVLQ